jgi:hypothetical protein
MEVPRIWRLEQVIVNPRIYNCNECNYTSIVPNRPVCPECGGTRNHQQTEDTLNPSARVTSPDYYNISETSHVTREVKPYSEMLLPEVHLEEIHIQVNAKQGTIYQAAQVTG